MVSHRTFIFTGFANNIYELHNLKIQITKLGGKYYDNIELLPNWTHLLCSLLMKKEKFLSACASGKWIVTPHYITQSYKAGRWLDEIDYEVSPANIGYMSSLSTAPRRCRLKVAHFNTGLFSEWKVLLLINNQIKKRSYERLLQCGGASVMQSVPLKMPAESFLRNQMYIFVDKDNSSVLFPNEQGVPCISLLYIHEFLIEDSPSLVEDYIVGTLPLENFIRKPFEEVMCKSFSSNVYNEDDQFPREKLQTMLDPMVQHTNCLKGNAVLSSKTNSLMNISIKSPNNKITLNENYAFNVKNMEADKVGILKPLKVKSNLISGINYDSAKEMPKIYNTLVEFCLEENAKEDAVNAITSLLSEDYYPQPKTLNTILFQILQATEKSSLLFKVYNYMCDLLSFHPPSNAKMSSFYYKTFVSNDISSDALWSVVSSALDSILKEMIIDDNTLFLLSFIIETTEKDFKKFIERSLDPKKEFFSDKSHPLIIYLFWNADNAITINKRCLEFFSHIRNGLNSVAGREKVMPLLFRLLTVVAEVFRIFCQCHVTETVLYPQLDILPLNIISHLNDVLDKLEVLQFFLYHIEPCWLKLKLCELLLTNDPLINKSKLDQSSPLTLRKILQYYMLLDPGKCFDSCIIRRNDFEQSLFEKGFDEMCIRNKKLLKKKHTGETELHQVCKLNNWKQLQKLLSIPFINVNVKDNFGWTPLHEACSYGHVECVKLLLNFLPKNGAKTCIDVGVASEDGTTPLHDAIQNNHVEISQMLLKYGGKILLSHKNNQGFTPFDFIKTEEMRKSLEVISSSRSIDTISSDKNVESQQKYLPPRTQCEKFVTLITFLLNCYFTLFHLYEIQDFLNIHSKCALSPSFNSKSFPKPKASSLIKSYFSDTLNCNISFSELVSRMDDLYIVQDMKKEINKFKEHINKYGTVTSDIIKSAMLELDLICAFCESQNRRVV